MLFQIDKVEISWKILASNKQLIHQPYTMHGERKLLRMCALSTNKLWFTKFGLLQSTCLPVTYNYGGGKYCAWRATIVYNRQLDNTVSIPKMNKNFVELFLFELCWETQSERMHSSPLSHTNTKKKRETTRRSTRKKSKSLPVAFEVYAHRKLSTRFVRMGGNLSWLFSSEEKKVQSEIVGNCWIGSMPIEWFSMSSNGFVRWH